MKQVALFSGLLIIGLIGSQILPRVLSENATVADLLVRLATMIGLAFIMIHVGYEFELDKSNPRQYGWDYLVAATAAAFPWLFCCLYFIFVMTSSNDWGSWQSWKESLLASRFASPTSAGILFSMLAAAGLGATWMYGKARVLAIFDDLDTILLLIPLQIAMVGFRWQLLVVVGVMIAVLYAAYRWLHVVRLPITWPWVMSYSILLVAVSELFYVGSKVVDPQFPVHLEVLLPAFALGCVLMRPAGHDPHIDDALVGNAPGPELPSEQRVATIVSSVFMFCVGLSVPLVATLGGGTGPDGQAEPINWWWVAVHVAAITVLSNVGKMFVSLAYRDEATWRERLALGLALWPRGEVGAGVLVLSLSYGIGGRITLVATLSLALNLLMTGPLISVIKRLLSGPRGPVRRRRRGEPLTEELQAEVVGAT